MFYKNLKVMALAGVALGLMLFNVRPAFAGAFNESGEISLSVPDCDGDWVALTGTVHAVGNVTTTKSGRLNVNGHLNAKATGAEDDSGGDKDYASFQGSAESNFSLHVDTNGDGLFVLSTPFNIKLIGQGQEPNFVLHGNFHITVNANDDVSAVSFDFNGPGCQGE
jgi:hypothetical protein